MATYLTPALAWRRLREGNERFVAGESSHPNQDASRRSSLVENQHPFAVIFGCSDSRLAAEIIFDLGLGDAFVVRTAGQVIDDAVLGSLEYSISVLGVPLIVVLGHDSCGAVSATKTAVETGQMPVGFIRDLVERITPSVLTSLRNDETRSQRHGGGARQADLPAPGGQLACDFRRNRGRPRRSHRPVLQPRGGPGERGFGHRRALSQPRTRPEHAVHGFSPGRQSP